MRLVESPHYSDAALSVYMKVKALGRRPEGCTAGVTTLASYLGLSASTIQRGLAQLRAPAPDGVVELPDSRRRSLPGGLGTTACRRVRPMRPAERFIWLPIIASERLKPRLLRAYAIIAYTVLQKIPLTERVLAGFLRHHSGRRAGQALTTDAAGRIVDELADAGWISVERRGGSHGRHVFALPDRAGAPSPLFDDPSGSEVGESSLVKKEDLMIDRPENDAAPVPPAVGEVQVGKVDENRSGKTRVVGTARGRALRADANALASPDLKKPYRGPQPTFSSRLHRALEPVRFLLPEVTTYLQRKIGQEIARQLDDGTTVARLQARLEQRLARTFVADISDPGRWLLGFALPRWGCSNPDCEEGTLWSTGARCHACQEVIAERARVRGTTTDPHGKAVTAQECLEATVLAADALAAGSRVVECCPACERPHRPGNSGLCARCRTHPDSIPAAPVNTDYRAAAGTCACGRPAAYGRCWRCRLDSDDHSLAAGHAQALQAPAVQLPHRVRNGRRSLDRNSC